MLMSCLLAECLAPEEPFMCLLCWKAFVCLKAAVIAESLLENWEKYSQGMRKLSQRDIQVKRNS